MKQFLLGVILALGVAAPGFAAEDLIGDWRTAKDDNGNSGLVRVTTCGNTLCGTLIKAFDASGAEMQSDNIGRKIIWDTVAQGGGRFKGRLYSPDRDKEYRSKLVLTGNSLSVSGCVLVACREGGVWTRAD